MDEEPIKNQLYWTQPKVTSKLEKPNPIFKSYKLEEEKKSITITYFKLKSLALIPVPKLNFEVIVLFLFIGYINVSQWYWKSLCLCVYFELSMIVVYIVSGSDKKYDHFLFISIRK